MADTYQFRSLQASEVPGGPYGWIQHKGTDLCMDVTCVCGEGGHFDGDFGYFLKCPSCGRVYETGTYIKLHEVPAEEVVRFKLDVKEMSP